ncbi:MAG: tol-pal system-associated acyl-CoA thioesterase [Wenzhouxiangellaceae bacterium]|nr:tol-pal system-associated acyl-CoA thioesterase [Wenzhouxiangellaceae bacterium]
MTGPRHEFRYRVYWEHTDAGGVVYHARYLNFLERARSDWLTAMGIHQTRLRAEAGLIFVVTRVEIDFRRPARLDDELAVGVCVEHCGRARLDFVQDIHRDGELLITATVRAACLHADRFTPARLPKDLVERAREPIKNE